jgi:uncharacterized protein YndB with AHSA1/START domain
MLLSRMVALSNAKIKTIVLQIIEKSIEINTTPDKVWRVFVEPETTHKMGGEYVSEWKVGSSLGWRGADGKMYTNGTILQVEPNALLQHNLIDPEDEQKVISIITYQFTGTNGRTILSAKEELNYQTSDDQFKESLEGWEIALQAVKVTAEKL